MNCNFHELDSATRSSSLVATTTVSLWTTEENKTVCGAFKNKTDMLQLYVHFRSIGKLWLTCLRSCDKISINPRSQEISLTPPWLLPPFPLRTTSSKYSIWSSVLLSRSKKSFQRLQSVVDFRSLPNIMNKLSGNAFPIFHTARRTTYSLQDLFISLILFSQHIFICGFYKSCLASRALYSLWSLLVHLGILHMFDGISFRSFIPRKTHKSLREIFLAWIWK